MMDRVFRGSARPQAAARPIESSIAAARAMTAGAVRGIGIFLALVSLAGCRQPTAPGDPFLPFMRSRVPPPGTTAAPGADPYYSGAAGAAAPAGAPTTVPVVPPPTTPVDKYSPRGGFNVPQGSIDRTKAIDVLKPNEVRSSATSFARRAVSREPEDPTSDNTQLASADSAVPAAQEIAAQTTVEPAAAEQVAAKQPEYQPDPVDLAAASRAMSSMTDWAASGPAANLTAAPTALPASALAAPALTSAAGTAEPIKATAASPTARAKNSAVALATTASPTGQSAGPAAQAVRMQSQAGATPASEGRTTLRIRPTAEDAFADADEPVVATAVHSDARLRMTAGTAEARNESRSTLSRPVGQVPQESAMAAAVRPNLKVPGGDSGVVQASWIEPDSGSAERSASTSSSTGMSSSSSAPTGPAGLYGYEPSYASLSGRLEYSESARQWKLRYIPIDGQTDQFGGSVLLADSSRIEGFKPGDFVSVRGSITSAGQSSRGFSPRYELSQIDAIH